MTHKVNVKKLKKIRENYFSTWSWMQDKARWEHMSIGAVLYNWEDYIDLMMIKEDLSKKELAF